MNTEQLIHQKREMLEQVRNLEMEIWTNHVLFSWRWWLGIALIIVPIILWVLFRKRDSTYRLYHAGAFAAIVSSLLDMFGNYFALWDYQYEVFPPMKVFLPWDLVVLPVTIMFLLQIKPQANPWIKAMVYGFLTSFVALPLLTYLELYEPIRWRFIYSLPIQVVIFMAAHAISQRFKLKTIK